MTLRDLHRRAATFIAARQTDMEDARAFGAGQAAVLVQRESAVAAGVVTGPTTETDVWIDGPYDELDALRSVDALPAAARIMFNLPAKDLAVTPRKGDRLQIGERTFRILSVEPRLVRGAPTSWVLRCGEAPTPATGGPDG